MYFLIFIVMIACIYVYSFKDDFKKESVERVQAVLVVGSVVIFILTIISGLNRSI